MRDFTLKSAEKGKIQGHFDFRISFFVKKIWVYFEYTNLKQFKAFKAEQSKFFGVPDSNYLHNLCMIVDTYEKPPFLAE